MSGIVRQYDLLLGAYGEGNVAALFGNWLIIGTFSLCLLLWMLVSAARFWTGVARLRRALDHCYGVLAASPAKAREFVGTYEEISAKIQSDSILGPAWRDWAATLITPTAPGMPIRSTSRPEAYFSIELLRACGINPRLHAAMPNLLVGVGLLLTFLGLSIALSAAGNIVSSQDRIPGLKGLLDAASAKFVTSLIGLLCSLIYTVLRGQWLVKAERGLDRFLAALEERIPLATPANLQAEANTLLEKSLAAQEQFATEVAVNIGGRLDSALDQRLGEHIGPLREAIERLSQGIGTKSEDTLRTLLEQFREMLQGSAQGHMEKVAAALADTSSGMDQIRSGLAEAANRMASAADQIAEQMGRNAEQAMARITQQMEGLVGELRNLAEQSRSAGNDAMAQAAARIAEAGESFGQAARAISNSLEQTVAGITTRLGGEAEAATRRMTEEITRAISSLKDLAEQNRASGDEATRAMAERIGQAAAGFERSAAQVAEALAGGAGDAAGKLTAAVEELREHFSRLTGDMAGNLDKAGEHFERHGRAGAGALAEAAAAAAYALRTGGADGGEAIRSGGADASRGLQAAAGELAVPAREMAQRIAAFQAEALELGRALGGMRQAAIDATAPLRATATDLVKLGASGQQTAADLATAAQRIAPLADTINGAMQKLGAAEERLGTLSRNLEDVLMNFGDLDTSLGKVFKDLREGLSGFASQIATFVTETNNDMAKAVTTLNGAVIELRDTYENSPPRAKPN